MKPNAVIIGYSADGERICANAARISTTPGTANELFQEDKNAPDPVQRETQNRNLIQKVLSSGHKSVIEHAVFNLALDHVSAFVEQFFIECRLASFTVKSRRYVDFRQAGYYTPSNISPEEQSLYQDYMDRLFSAYAALLELGIPKEDARFLLPYSFHSTFYCSMNARELIQVIHAMKYRRGAGNPELLEIADQLERQLLDCFPAVRSELMRHPQAASLEDTLPLSDFSLVDKNKVGAVRLLNKGETREDMREKLQISWAISHPNQPFDWNALVKSERPRELEQLSFSFCISDLTLSGITHIVRHRMQSILIPPIQTVQHSRYILPDTIKDNAEALNIYMDTLHSIQPLLQQFAANRTLSKYGCYYALSGNMLNIMTTINARELMLLIRLRTCNRAQWEIRNVAMEMLRQLREYFPDLFSFYGPSCYTLGHCPEGKMSCGAWKQIKAEFGSDNQTT